MTTAAPQHRTRRVFRSSGVHGDLVYVLAHARARALAVGVGFIYGPEGDCVSIALVDGAWSVTPASFFTPAWMTQVDDILAHHGQEGTP